MSDEPDEDFADITPEEAAKIYAAAPPAVRAEIERESAEANKEMLAQFEEGAKEYEKANP